MLKCTVLITAADIEQSLHLHTAGFEALALPIQYSLKVYQTLRRSPMQS